MMVEEEKSKLRMLDPVDKLSNLPESLLHHIISFLSTKEACRTSILSKTWRDIWATSPILDFQAHYFINQEQISELRSRRDESDHEWFDHEANEKYIGFIETRMRNYSVKRLSIKKLRLEALVFNHDMASNIDKWLGIAVENQVEDLSVSITSPNSFSYTLPPILFFAKSLKSLSCSMVKIPSYEPSKFGSITCLDLCCVTIEESLLQHIINSCPLDTLLLMQCSGIKIILIPHFSKLKVLRVMRVVEPGGMIMVESSSLVHLSYHSRSNGWVEELSWPCKTNVELRNLRILSLFDAAIRDEILAKLLSGLAVLEELTFHSCRILENIHVYGSRLKRLSVSHCNDLTRVTINTPNLGKLSYRGYEDVRLIASNIPIQCEVHVIIICEVFDTYWFIRLKKFLVESSICRVLELGMPVEVPMVVFDEVEAASVSPVPSYKLPELRVSPPQLLLSSLSIFLDGLPTFVDGLLWSCHPDLLVIPLTISDGSAIAGSLIELLKSRVESPGHPLTGIEVAGTDYSSGLLGFFPQIVLRFKLHW